ncbi:CheW-like domain protein [Enhygromyxa salina]|uniref:CheW-like domain protein n=2 Tax=Enhygromyxa salina TaxID=215803 RepID=A0A2S9XQV2_9BACT|nr:CheW-like domain protein [Enhygromyxa salina]
MPVALGAHHVAVEALAVLEILGPREWVRIPNTRPLLPGALAWRGRAIGVLDLAPALRLPALEAPNTRGRNAVLRVDDDVVVITIDRVLEVRRASVDAIKPVHATRWLVERGVPCRGELELELERDLDTDVIPVLDLEAWASMHRSVR